MTDKQISDFRLPRHMIEDFHDRWEATESDLAAVEKERDHFMREWAESTRKWHETMAALSETQQERDRQYEFNIRQIATQAALEQQVTQQADTINAVTGFLEAIVIAFKEPDGGPCFKLRAFAESKGIYADDLGRDRVMLRIAQAALDSIPEEKP